MGKKCPLMGIATYLDCLECDEKPCEQIKYNKVIVGIDQSYNNTGISIAADGKLLKVKSIDLSKYENNSDKRKVIKAKLTSLLKSVLPKTNKLEVVIERIRLHSKGFLNIDYIKSIGALNSVIVDVCNSFRINVYSVDTRCWKSQVIGTSKGKENKFGVPAEKWPTVEWVIERGFEKEITIEVTGRKTKGTFTRNGKKYMYNNDAADSAGIAMFGFIGEKDKLKQEH